MNGNRVPLIWGLTIGAAILLLGGLALYLAPKLGEGGPLTGHGHHSEAGTCPQSAVPKSFQGQGIKCTVGSPNWFKNDESTLDRSRKYMRRDSQLWIHNGTNDGHIARVVGTGCHGGKRYVYDRDDSFMSGGVNKSFNCNMDWHITQRMINGRWKNNEFGSLHN